MSTTPLPPFVRSTLLEILHNRQATVKFRKVNGDLRTMYCTLKLELMPQLVQDTLVAKRLKEEADRAEPCHQCKNELLKGLHTCDDKKKPNLDLVTVYDLEANDWRSFRLDSIIEVL